MIWRYQKCRVAQEGIRSSARHTVRISMCTPICIQLYTCEQLIYLMCKKHTISKTLMCASARKGERKESELKGSYPSRSKRDFRQPGHIRFA